MSLNKPIWKLRDWIDIDKLEWDYLSLSTNKNAISLLEKNLDKIDWSNLSENKNAISLLEKNLDKIDWKYLSFNKNAISVYIKNVLLKMIMKNIHLF